VKRLVILAVGGLLCAALARPAGALERVHYIAADEVLWNYAPHGKDLIAGKPLPALGPFQLGWVYHKLIYREYTDGTFTTLRRRSPRDAYLGLVGPVIHAQVGDTVVIVFRNHSRLPVNIAPGGMASNPRPKAVGPGGTQTYRWPIREQDGPGENDGSSILYTYQSTVAQTADENAGLIGPLIVTRWGSARADGSPKDVDQEMVALFSTQVETRSVFFQANLADKTTNSKRIARHQSTLFVLSNAFPSINGFSFGNMPIPELRSGERVRWYLLSTQNDLDGHAATWDGATVISQGNRMDTVSLVSPHMIADMVPDNPGLWLLVCTLNVHLEAGMEARYRVVSDRGSR
jgi:FtsP/CotA-like multicopper oxidase with cupredoxin domain